MYTKHLTEISTYFTISSIKNKFWIRLNEVFNN